MRGIPRERWYPKLPLCIGGKPTKFKTTTLFEPTVLYTEKTRQWPAFHSRFNVPILECNIFANDLLDPYLTATVSSTFRVALYDPPTFPFRARRMGEEKKQNNSSASGKARLHI